MVNTFVEMFEMEIVQKKGGLVFQPAHIVHVFVEMFEMEIVQQMYAPQTKILGNGTDGRACRFEALCEGVSTQFGALSSFLAQLEYLRV